MSARILNVKDIILEICRLQTSDNPIKLVLSVPTSAMTVNTPKYPAAAIVNTENKSVTKFIHLVAIF